MYHRTIPKSPRTWRLLSVASNANTLRGLALSSPRLSFFLLLSASGVWFLWWVFTTARNNHKFEGFTFGPRVKSRQTISSSTQSTRNIRFHVDMRPAPYLFVTPDRYWLVWPVEIRLLRTDTDGLFRNGNPTVKRALNGRSQLGKLDKNSISLHHTAASGGQISIRCNTFVHWASVSVRQGQISTGDSVSICPRKYKNKGNRSWQYLCVQIVCICLWGTDLDKWCRQYRSGGGTIVGETHLNVISTL